MGTKLVEWQDDGIIQRGWVPADAVDADLHVADIVLKRAAPYGLPLHRILQRVVIDPEQLADAMHRRGLWTKEELLRNANAIAQAILSSCGTSASRVQTLVREYEVGEKT